MLHLLDVHVHRDMNQLPIKINVSKVKAFLQLLMAKSILYVQQIQVQLMDGQALCLKILTVIQVIMWFELNIFRIVSIP